MSLSLGLGLALTRNNGGADALHGVQVQAARSPGRTFFRNGLRRSTALTDVATVTRATQAWGVDQGGNVSSFAAGQPVVNTAGLAVYEARTNSIRNPTGLGAVVGTPGAEPTYWYALQTSDGLSRQVVGFGTTSSGLPYVDIRYSGTTTTDWFISNPFEVAGVVTASQGQTWTHSCYMALVGGSLANLTSATLRIAQHGAAAAYLGEVTGTAPSLMGLTANLTKVTVSGVADNASVISVSPYWQVHYPNGVAVDFTLRIAAPNLKLGADIGDPPILQTNNAAATRNADVITETVSIPPGRAFTVTGKWVVAAALSVFPTLFSLDDGSGYPPQNLMSLYVHGDTRPRVQCISAGALVDTNTNVAIAGGSVLGMAVSVSGSQVTYSVNGSEAASFTMPGGAFAAALLRAGLGCYAPTSAARLDGTVRDLNIVMRAYSAAELQAASDVSLTHDLDFVSQVYQYVGAPYLTPTDLPGTTFSRPSSGVSEAGDGTLIAFSAGNLRVTSKGVLIEAAATNLLLYSQAFDVGAWAKTNGGTTVAVTADAALGPDGAATADKIWENSITTGPYDVAQSVTAVNGTYTFSAYFKPAERSFAHIRFTDLTTGGGSAVFNLTTGAATVYATAAGSWTNISAGAVPAGGGYYRCWLTATKGAGASMGVCFGPHSGAGTEFYTGVVGQGVYVDRVQVEGGSFPSSHIATAAAMATRNTDILASANDTNPSAYTVVAEFTVPATGPTTGLVWQWDDGTANNKSLLYYNRSTGRLYCQVYAGGVIQANLNLGAVTAGNSYNVALRVAANDFAASLGGAAVVTDTSGTVPTTSVFRFGADIPGAGGMWSGYIKRIRRYSVGKTNSELQALVA